MKLIRVLYALCFSVIYGAVPADSTSRSKTPEMLTASSTVTLSKNVMIHQLSEGLDGGDQWLVTDAISKIDPSRYTEAFTSTCKNLMTESMSGVNRYMVIVAVARIDSSGYEAFINTCRALMTERMSKFHHSLVIEAVTRISPSLYGTFINTCRALLPERMNEESLSLIIQTVSTIDPSCYTETFIRTCRGLMGTCRSYYRSVIEIIATIDPSLYTEAFVHTYRDLIERRNECDGLLVIRTIAKIAPSHYVDFINTCRNLMTEGINGYDPAFLINAVALIPETLWFFMTPFIEQNPMFFHYVPVGVFHGGIQNLSEAGMTQQALQAMLTGLHNEYFNQAPAGTPQGLAFEIHNVARNFNDEVLRILRNHLSGTALIGYDAAKLKIQEIFEVMVQEKEPHGGYLTQKILDWAIKCNADEGDKNILSLVITYLSSKGDDALKIWLSTFLEESAHAYSNSQNRESCEKGVKERVVTSLRNVSGHPQDLTDLIKKTERDLLLPLKVQKMGTDKIIPELKAYGLRSAMGEEDAQNAYLRFLKDVYFGEDLMGNKKVQEGIKVITDLFKGENGLWAGWKLKLRALEDSKSGIDSAATGGAAAAASHG